MILTLFFDSGRIVDERELLASRVLSSEGACGGKRSGNSGFLPVFDTPFDTAFICQHDVGVSETSGQSFALSFENSDQPCSPDLVARAKGYRIPRIRYQISTRARYRSSRDVTYYVIGLTLNATIIIRAISCHPVYSRPLIGYRR